MLEENLCSNNAWAGISYQITASGTARRNECSGNGGHGIYLQDRAYPTLEENVCSNNEWSGIAYFSTAGGVARQNECSENKHYGISINGSAEPTLEANICANNEWAGVAYSDTSAGAARQNECVGNEVGLFVDETADPELDDNDCHDNTETDIRDLR